MTERIESAFPEQSWALDSQPGGYTVTGGVGGISFSWTELLRGAKELEVLADELRRVELELDEIARQLLFPRMGPQLDFEASNVQYRISDAGVQTSVRVAGFQDLAERIDTGFRRYAAAENSLLVMLRQFEESTRPGYDAMGNRTMLPMVTEVDAWYHLADEATALLAGAGYAGSGAFDIGPISASLIPDTDGNREVANYDGSLSGLVERTGQSWVDGDGVENVIEVAVIETDGQADRYSVTIPGTKEWSPWETENPLDLTGNLAAIAGSPHMARAVADALKDAGAPEGAPVMLTGYSGGGLHARAVAADAAFLAKFDPQYVITAGSPVGNIPLPEGTQGLNLQQKDDDVVGLDLRAAPDTKNNVTVEFQTEPLENPDGSGRMDEHSLGNYYGKAELLETSDHPSITGTVAGIAAFAPAGAKVSSYKFSLERQTKPRPQSPLPPNRDKGEDKVNR